MYVPSPTLAASAGYTHATLAETQHGFVAGQRLPDVPQVTGTASMSYHTSLTAKHEFNARLEDSYIGNRVGTGTAFGLINQPLAPLPSYNLANARAGISCRTSMPTWKTLLSSACPMQLSIGRPPTSRARLAWI